MLPGHLCEDILSSVLVSAENFHFGASLLYDQQKCLSHVVKCSLSVVAVMTSLQLEKNIGHMVEKVRTDQFLNGNVYKK